MKSLLLLMHDDGGQEARFQVALDLGRAFGGHLTCLDAISSPALQIAELVAAGALHIQDDAGARNATMRETYQERLAVEDVTWDWQDAVGDVPYLVMRGAEFADLIILSSQGGRYGYPGSSHVIGDIMKRANRPVMAVPHRCTGIDLAGAALIAWDGSHAANAALRAALPLLRKAREVTLFQAVNGAAELAIEDAAIYLSRHGVPAQIIRKPAGTSASETIRRQIAETDPAYLVMGAFAHERIEEFLFGGVAQSMLSHCELPILLAH